jgi:hypothetical protein
MTSHRSSTAVAPLAVALLAVLLAGLLAGCGSASGTASSQATSSTASRSTPSSMAMADRGDVSGPSASARMVCSDEIREVVQTTFHLSARPMPTHTWRSGVFICLYRLPGGTLRVTVNDATNRTTGRRYFDKLRSGLPDPTRIRGVASLGFPAFETTSGNTVFLKDGKTLRVDASGLDIATLPREFSRRDVSYAVASAVVGCWTE